jgi:hypothetical protein
MNKSKKKLNQLIRIIQTHQSWFQDITGKDAEKILKGYPLHTYLLRKGENSKHYFLSYVVTDNHLVFHKSIRISANPVGYYPNGGVDCKPTKLYTTIESLISEFLGCREEDLLPLTSKLALAQGF